MAETEKKCQNFLRFLWWKDGDFSKEPFDQEMYAHVFEGVSSRAWSDYSLKRTAKENEEKYGTETACTLRENFYVDDLLKSVNSEDDVIKLIKNVRSICNEGGLNLTNLSLIARKSCTQYLRTLEKMMAKTKTFAANYLMNKHWVSCGM